MNWNLRLLAVEVTLAQAGLAVPAPKLTATRRWSRRLGLSPLAFRLRGWWTVRRRAASRPMT